MAALLACAACETWAGNAVGSAIGRLRGETGSEVVQETFSWDDVGSSREETTDGSGKRHVVSSLDPDEVTMKVNEAQKDLIATGPTECAFDPPGPEIRGWLTERGGCPGVGAQCTNSSAPSLPSNCTAECYNIGTCNQELGRCDCPRGTDGESCEWGIKTPDRNGAGDCLNQCSGKGQCDSGFCKCDPGFFAPTAPRTSTLPVNPG